MDRPIIFSGPMVRALLEGRKSQTRRVVPKQPKQRPDGLWDHHDYEYGIAAADETALGQWLIDFQRFAFGDRLWVRENISIMPRTAYALPKTICPDDPDMAAYYQADFDRSGKPRWRPSIHMPRWASRLTLTVSDVRVQRLQEISETDALAEGVERQDPTPDDWEWYRRWADEYGLDPGDSEGVRPVWLAPGTRQGFGPRKNDPQWGPTPEFAFRLLWDSINAKRGFGWATNPWVVALTFEVAHRNIDAEASNAR